MAMTTATATATVAYQTPKMPQRKWNTQLHWHLKMTRAVAGGWRYMDGCVKAMAMAMALAMPWVWEVEVALAWAMPWVWEVEVGLTWALGLVVTAALATAAVAQHGSKTTAVMGGAAGATAT
jgi:hypothetical protein